MDLSKFKRIVIKVGSSLIINEDNHLRKEWVLTLVEDIAALKKKGKQVIVVSSGAVALGRHVLGYDKRAILLEEKQAAAACGQIALISGWANALQQEQLYAAQILLTIDDSENRRRYLNARNTLETLLQDERNVPVINENDTVATAELRFGDNDRLAARVAQMISADALILFSDVKGLYNRNPHRDATAQLQREVTGITPEIEAMAGGVTSSVGNGGMITKIEAAKIALAAGCHMCIALGKGNHPLKTVMEGGEATWFIPSSTPGSARSHWISGAIAPAGTVVIDAGAAAALASGKSLLPAGVTSVEGQFGRGDAVLVKTQEGVTLGKGLIAYSSDDAARIIGHKSHEIERILGFKGRSVLIHRDDLALR